MGRLRVRASPRSAATKCHALTPAPDRPTINGVLLPGPLHRVTPLRRDPAAAWLSSGGRVALMFREWGVWILWFAVLVSVWYGGHYFLDTPFYEVGDRLSVPMLMAIAAGIFL